MALLSSWIAAVHETVRNNGYQTKELALPIWGTLLQLAARLKKMCDGMGLYGKQILKSRRGIVWRMHKTIQWQSQLASSNLVETILLCF
jgi:hypothetical protein